jgi:predicted Rossmann fold flavoprotein
LSGVSVSKVRLKIAGTALEQTGPLLITHWGFSGPAILKLSAWGARVLHDCNYQATLLVDWLPDFSQDELRERLLRWKTEQSSRLVATECPFELSRNLWKKLTTVAGISTELRWADLSNKALNALVETLHAGIYKIEGKSTYKEEFVTCGGVALDQVNWKTMESRLCPGLFFAGEVLDVDGVTGGFNFQNAWTTSWLAGQAMAN